MAQSRRDLAEHLPSCLFGEVATGDGEILELYQTSTLDTHQGTTSLLQQLQSRTRDSLLGME